MRTTSLRFLRLPVLAVSSLLLLTACGGSDDPAPVATNPDPVQPTQPQPTQPAPNQPGPVEPVLADTFTAWSNDTLISPPGWNAWVAPSGNAPVSGVGCLINENFHQHSLLSIYKDGVRQGLPDNIGRGGCTYELHTHDGTGVVHIETDVPKRFTLGQFLALWNQPLGRMERPDWLGPCVSTSSRTKGSAAIPAIRPRSSWCRIGRSSSSAARRQLCCRSTGGRRIFNESPIAQA